MSKAVLVLLSLASVFLCLALSSTASVLTCLPSTGAEASTGFPVSFANETGTLTDLYSITTNRDGSYVFAVFYGLVFRLPYDATTGLYNVSAREKIGQSGYVNNTCVPRRLSVCGPFFLHYDSLDRLWVVDNGAKRIVRYDNVSTSTYKRKVARPQQVIGVNSWTQYRNQSDTRVSDFYLAGPIDVSYDENTDSLYVLDRNGTASRVLRYDSISSQPLFGVTAQVVFGQDNLTSLSQRTPGPNTFSLAVGVNVDQNTGDLYVADASNNRVLVFENASALSIDANASYVIGQPNFYSVVANASDYQLASPSQVFFDESSDVVFITDRGNNRIVAYKNTHRSEPTFTLVIGQNDFNTGAQRNTSASSLNLPYQGAYNVNNGILFVADSGNQRILTFGPCASTTSGTTSSGTTSSGTTSSGTTSSGTTSSGTTSSGTTGTSTGTTSGTTGGSSLRRRMALRRF